ncbi:hypothetical protein Cgig2_032067 [Carnegiea gigantea]|uniref:Uncharacterized protein n=1 Tax=Carnegiea gigantea TaxID=171969 RepID=A0A9Q1JYN5_9CARY|nr:hypothetical protein Cgig2_032067 [Carnegiea gigantea]
MYPTPPTHHIGGGAWGHAPSLQWRRSGLIMLKKRKEEARMASVGGISNRGYPGLTGFTATAATKARVVGEVAMEGPSPSFGSPASNSRICCPKHEVATELEYSVSRSEKNFLRPYYAEQEIKGGTMGSREHGIINRGRQRIVGAAQGSVTIDLNDLISIPHSLDTHIRICSNILKQLASYPSIGCSWIIKKSLATVAASNGVKSQTDPMGSVYGGMSRTTDSTGFLGCEGDGWFTQLAVAMNKFSSINPTM